MQASWVPHSILVIYMSLGGCLGGRGDRGGGDEEKVKEQEDMEE